MREALLFYKEVQKQYAWLHIIVGIILMCTAVFWFIVPLFIICYGLLDMTSIGQLLTFASLFAIPALISTLHCSYISFRAATIWSKKTTTRRFQWFIIFQAVSFTIALTFITSIYSLFIVIDMLR